MCAIERQEKEEEDQGQERTFIKVKKQKKYDVIYADPPWQYRQVATGACGVGIGGGAQKYYETMSLYEIMRLPVEQLASNDSALFLWVTMPMLSEGLKVIEAWGFQYKTCAFVWVKQNKKSPGLFWGLGHWTRSNAEVCLLGIRGRPIRKHKGIHSVVISRVSSHSRKPLEVQTKIMELLGDVRRIELFSRNDSEIDGWDTWGSEASGSLELEQAQWHSQIENRLKKHKKDGASKRGEDTTGISKKKYSKREK